MIPPALPAHVSRSERFDRAGATVLASIDPRWHRQLERIEVAVEMVPPSDPAPWESGVPLTRVFPADQGQPTRLVVYRKPLEQRARHDSLLHVIRDVMVEALAHVWRCQPEDIDPDYGA